MKKKKNVELTIEDEKKEEEEKKQIDMVKLIRRTKEDQ